MNFNNLTVETSNRERELFFEKPSSRKLEEKSFRKNSLRQKWALKLLPSIYQKGIIQTLWNTKDLKYLESGWILKNNSWSPWFLNLRALGNFPCLFRDVCYGMAELVDEESYNFNTLIGVEMAGIPLASSLAIILHEYYGKAKKIGYTRPLPRKPRTLEEALTILNNLDLQAFTYGQKSFVEVGFENKDRVAIVDDMATDLSSKLISRLIILREAERRGVQIECNKIFYFLNRNKNNALVADYFQYALPELYPAKLEINYLIEFEDCLPLLKSSMRAKEFETIMEYQKDPLPFQKKGLIALVKKQAREDRCKD